MEWFTSWYESLNTVQQVLAAGAIPATVILIIQTVLLMFGVGGHDADHGEFDHDFSYSHDFDGHIDHDFDHSHDFDEHIDHDGAHHLSGVRIFTIRGLVAMFSVGGWLGIAMIDLGVSNAISVIIAFVGGFLALILVALVLKLMLSLQQGGNIDPKNAIAKTAKVYLTIPASRKGTGKVTFTLQERFVEMDAVTDFTQDIKTDSMVQIVSVTDNCLVVRPL